MPNPSLDAFELAVARGDAQAATVEMLAILRTIDDRYGRVDLVGGTGIIAERRVTQIATRFAAAFSRLLMQEPIPFNALVFEHLAHHHRWLELMFSVGGFGSADFLLPQLSGGVADAAGRRVVPPESVARLLLVFSAAAAMQMDLDEALITNPAATITACLGYLGSRFCYTEGAHALRERLLAWLPDKLAQVTLGDVALVSIASPYMHCSYAMTPDKHRIKGPIVAQMRRACLAAGAPEMSAPPAPAARPTIVVTTENFTDGHSIHRTHSRAVTALRRDFNVVGVVYEAHITPPIEACFDEIITYKAGMSGAAAGTAREVLARAPAMVLHLGVGMSPYVIALASLRLAPVQAASFGHTATTMSPVIDYMILPEDFIGDPALFSETVVGVPAAAMPYAPRTDTDYAAVRERGAASRAARRERAGATGGARIAIPASVMKLGPQFFEALARAARDAGVPVAYEVFPLGSHGLGHAELVLRLATRLPMAEVNHELDYADYIERLAACDFFVCPFPYGNMNSILDAVQVGLPGVCLDGAEAHAHADAAYFKRMKFPAALTAQSVDAYVAAIARLARDPKWLARCQRAAAEADLQAAFFDGDPGLFVDAVKGLLAGAGARQEALADT